MKLEARISYFKGDKIRCTGKTEIIAGGEFEICVYLEGPDKGKTLHVRAGDLRYAR